MNGALSRTAFVLTELARLALQLEDEYAEKNPGKALGYQFGFPELVASFICPEQGHRQINVLAFREIETVWQMKPLINIISKDQMRVDLRTSAWIMGKLLKLLDFVHSQDYAIKLVTTSNILIEPDQHYVMFFDWMDAEIFTGVIPMEKRRSEIANVAKAVIRVLGGDLNKRIIPNDGDGCFGQYADFLWRLARRGESRAEHAHRQFYDMIDEFWPREFYPFTVKPLE